MKDWQTDFKQLQNLVFVIIYHLLSLKQIYFCSAAETRIIVNRRTEKVTRVFSFGAFPSIVRSFAIVVRRVFVLRTRWALWLFSSPSLPLGLSVRWSSSFSSYSRRGEAAPRASRCFICLSALFITCNLALTRARVISYWFSAPLPFVPRAVASSPLLFSLSSHSLYLRLLLQFFCLSSGRWTSSVTSVLDVDCYANEKCRKAMRWDGNKLNGACFVVWRLL